MPDQTVLIAGGGIGGLALALTLHQIGVRELLDMGFSTDELDRVSLPAKKWALVGLNGKDIYAEPHGLDAGYAWPQYAAHRGQLHMALYQKLIARAGAETVQLCARVVSYQNNADGGVTATFETANGRQTTQSGALLIGADGIHSAIRAQMHPAQPSIH